MRGLRSSLGLSGSELFDPAMQDRLAQELLRQRGNDPAGLRNEWEGLRRIDASTIRTAYDGTSVAMPAVDEGVAAQRQERADDAERQREAYKGITEDAARFRTEMTLEQQALGMTSIAAAKLRYEHDMLAEAQRAGITLSPTQRQELASLAQGMAEVEEATRRAATTQGEMRAVQDFMGQSVHGFFSSIVTGSATVEQALQRVVASLADAALEAALLGSGPLASLFGGASGGAGGGIFGALFGSVTKGFASGGHVKGPGTGTSDSIPARLSNGEFVVNAAATRQHRAVLEAINSGTVHSFSTGGPVGSGSSYVGATTRSTTFSPTVNVKVEGGSSGDRSQDEAYAASIADAVNAQMEAKFAEMLQDESRPGGMVARRRFTA